MFTLAIVESPFLDLKHICSRIHEFHTEHMRTLYSWPNHLQTIHRLYLIEYDPKDTQRPPAHSQQLKYLFTRFCLFEYDYLACIFQARDGSFFSSYFCIVLRVFSPLFRDIFRLKRRAARAVASEPVGQMIFRCNGRDTICVLSVLRLAEGTQRGPHRKIRFANGMTRKESRREYRIPSSPILLVLLHGSVGVERRQNACKTHTHTHTRSFHLFRVHWECLYLSFVIFPCQCCTHSVLRWSY